MSTIAPTTFTFEERVNPTYCDILAKITFKQFKQFYSVSELEQNGDSIELTTQYNLLRNYCTEMIHNNYTRLSTYHYSGNKINGRLFLKDKMGLQRIWAKFRGVLSDGITRDIDMFNAHPVLLAFICKLHKIECPKLNRYIHTRQECFADLYKTDKIVAADAKILFIKSINSCNPVDTFKKKTIKDSFFISYDQEMKAIQSKLCTIYKDLYNELKKTKPNNAEGSLVNHLLCIKENELLQKIMTAIKTYYKPSVPMFDGLMFFNNHDSGITDDALIELLNTVTLAEGITWSFKPHNCEIKEILDNLDVTNNVNFFIGDTELDVAMYCVSHIFKNKLVKCQGEVYVYDNKIWTKNDTPNIISKIIGYHDLYIGSTNGDKLISKSTSMQNSLTELIMRNVITDNKFNKKMYDETLQKLCFQNGYYDFKLSKFIEYTDDNIPLTPFIIDRDYIVNKSAYEDIYKRILYPVFNIILDDKNEIVQTESNLQNIQELKYMLRKFSRMIAGHARDDKQWLILKGSRNSGKGLLTELFQNSFEKYVSSTNSDNFLTRQTIGEESKMLAWMNDFEFTRIIFSQEITILFDKKGKKCSTINGNLIKKISGGDELECRLNHKDARKFHHQSTLVICCNDVPKISPDCANDNLHTFNMPCSFFTDEAWDNMDEIKKLEYPFRRVADTNIKTQFCNNVDVINSFINMIIEAYNWNIKCPSKIKEEKLNDCKDSDFARFMNLFVFTAKDDDNKCDNCSNPNKDIYCEEHIVYNSRIEELLELHNINITKQKICKLLANILFLKPIITSTKKRGFKGLYEKVDN